MPLPQLASFTDRRDSHKVQETEVGHLGPEERKNQIPEEPRVQQDLLRGFSSVDHKLLEHFNDVLVPGNSETYLTLLSAVAVPVLLGAAGTRILWPLQCIAYCFLMIFHLQPLPPLGGLR